MIPGCSVFREAFDPGRCQPAISPGVRISDHRSNREASFRSPLESPSASTNPDSRVLRSVSVAPHPYPDRRGCFGRGSAPAFRSDSPTLVLGARLCSVISVLSNRGPPGLSALIWHTSATRVPSALIRTVAQRGFAHWFPESIELAKRFGWRCRARIYSWLGSNDQDVELDKADGRNPRNPNAKSGLIFGHVAGSRRNVLEERLAERRPG
jgi:hypothetical protein